MYAITQHSIKKILLLPLVASAVVFCQPVHADAQQVMDQMLSTYINVTPGSSFETQRRGGITLGSVAVRSRVVRPQLIAIEPPSFRGSCSGFDLIGGSFSFLNGEQLQQFLRAIASNALNYAFTLALEGVCPTCMQKMEKLRDWSEAINSKLMDSCHWGEQMVNATRVDEWAKSEPAEGSIRATVSGAVDDFFESADSFVSKLTRDQQNGEVTAQNATMAAVTRSNLTGWWGPYGDQDLAEVAMSVIGTVIKRPPRAGETCTNKDGDEEYCIDSLPDILDVDQFLNGSLTGPVTLYRCNDYPDCLDVSEQTLNNWPGLKTRIRNVMFGVNGTSGIVGKYLNPVGQDWTVAEQSLVEGSPAPVKWLLESMSKNGGSVISIANQIVDIIAIQIARDMLLSVVTNVERSFGKDAIQMSAVMMDRMTRKMNKFVAQTSYEDRLFDNSAKLVEFGNMVRGVMAATEQSQAALPTGSNPKR